MKHTREGTSKPYVGAVHVPADGNWQGESRRETQNHYATIDGAVKGAGRFANQVQGHSRKLLVFNLETGALVYEKLLEDCSDAL